MRVFESGAILLYLAEKFGAFLPTEPRRAAECLSWLFWQMGSAPYLGGGFGHFYAYAPEKIEYAIDRFAMEVKRQLDVLDRASRAPSTSPATHYTIADIAVWPWYGAPRPKGLLYSAGEFLQVQELPPRATLDGRRSPHGRRCSAAAWSTAPGEPSSQLHERHDASDFDTCRHCSCCTCCC
jgi:GST-like protein